MPGRPEGNPFPIGSLDETLVQNLFDPTKEGEFDFSALQKTVIHDASIRPSEQDVVPMLELSKEQQERLRELGQQRQPSVQEIPGGLQLSDDVLSSLKKIEIKRQKEIRTEVKEISLEQKRKMVGELWKGMEWPGLPKNEMKQGSGGNCYAISALEAIKRNPDAFDTLLSRLEKVSDTVWRVYLHNAETGAVEPVDVDLKELEEDKEHSMSSGSLGDKVIERAFQSFVSRKRRRRTGDEQPIGKTMIADRLVSIDGQVVEKKQWEGGIPHKVLFELLGKPYQKFLVKEQEDVVGALHEIAKDQASPVTDQRILATVFTKEGFESPKRKDAPWKVWQKENDTPLGVISQHAYTLGRVDLENGIVHVVNPHHTSKTYEIPFKDFFQYFDGISYVKRMQEDEQVINQTLGFESDQNTRE